MVVAATASAEPARGTITGGPRAVMIVPAPRLTTPPPAISKTLYLERCKGDCVIHSNGSTSDARTNFSAIPNPGDYNVNEFENAAHVPGIAADAEWNMFVTCMKEVYSPFNVTVTDVKPAAGISFHLALVAGKPAEVGLGNDILGIAPLAGDCSAQDNVISFSFANAHPQTDPTDRALNICWTVSQESAHAFGLDHQFVFADGRSACNDPMTYRTDCGGEKFFRNLQATCGEFMGRNCRCGPQQNSHLKLLSVFGEGTSIVAAPTSTITNPAVEDQALPPQVVASAFSKRGVDHVDLLLNGFKWATARGANYGPQGQPESAYGLLIPADVPSPSKYDIVARACDDLGNCTESAVVHGFKGDPAGCADASVCAEGQKCTDGKCLWDSAGEIGDGCSVDQFCASGLCSPTTDDRICTQGCVPGLENQCPDDLECIQTGNTGFCYFKQGGCCSVSNDSPGRVLVHIGLAGLMLGFVMRRRRKQA